MDNVNFQTKTRIFSESEIKVAENMLNILAFVSVNFWSKAIISKEFIVNGTLLDYEVGYKNRIRKIMPDPNSKPITSKQLISFQENYLQIAKNSTIQYLADDRNVANLLNQKERVMFDSFHHGEDTFCFGGWDNDAVRELKEAMRLAKIKGMMNINSSYRKTYVTLFSKDANIRNGWYTRSDILYQIH